MTNGLGTFHENFWVFGYPVQNWHESVTFNTLPWQWELNYTQVSYIFRKVLVPASNNKKQKWKILVWKKVIKDQVV
jgi:hypothetical protein